LGALEPRQASCLRAEDAPNAHHRRPRAAAGRPRGLQLPDRGARRDHPLRRRSAVWQTGWRNWRSRVWKEAAETFLEGDLRPYRLRGSFASLLIWEGRPTTYVAAQLGHSIQTCGRYYLGLFEMFDIEQRVPAADMIRAARGHRDVRAMYAESGREVYTGSR
jgi:integrase